MSTCENIHHCRTMVGIISSCLTTVFTCTWVAIHPNIPAPYEISLEITLRHIGVMLCALIAPELMIVWAMRQWFAAGRIAKKYEARKWTRTHGFFVQMGGFMLVDDQGRPIQPLILDDLDDLDGSEFPQITEIEIQDRSKRDPLSKALIMVQTTWFILQCVARSLQQLPITELESATLAFTILNFATYALWWSKPVDVRCPYPVRKNRKPEIAPRDESKEESTEKPKGGSEGSHEGSDREEEGNDGLKGEGSSSKGYKEVNLNEFDAEKGEDDDERGGGFSAAVGRIHSKARNWLAELWSFVKMGSPVERILVIPFLPFVAVPMELLISISDMDVSDPDDRKEQKRVPTFYAGETTDSELTQLILISSFIATAFGAIHCLAWHVQVQSPTQLLLWRVSSVTITSMPILTVFAYKSKSADMLYPLEDVVEMLLLLSPSMYIAARITLFVLTFTSLRSIPPGAYETVVWTTFVPHL
ncbi:hypothetical protein JAAARDRAFT_165583 [Jaapia argillacea MUCL 33604]|uniref:Uncharacterized protein n=1 Tax=Jaapia argillacea MUCL 33604 TaxID=933084 RepID=A0A067PES7_9AGAM|nr:hypothetical protein JAAARDRAFT_165583 [Jaapia argillacea MUCL 33604]